MRGTSNYRCQEAEHRRKLAKSCADADFEAHLLDVAQQDDELTEKLELSGQAEADAVSGRLLGPFTIIS